MKSKSELPFRKRAWHSHALCILLLAVLTALPATLAAQEQQSVLNIRVSYKTENTPLTKVLKDLRELTNVRFTYNLDLIRKQPPVSVKSSPQRLEDILKSILQGTNLLFAETIGGGIIIYPEEKEETEPGTGKKQPAGLVSGQVISENKTLLPGISIRNTTNGNTSVSGDKGLFTIMAAEGDMLRFSGVGVHAATKEVKEPFFVFEMKPMPEDIKEVVVNGYQRIENRMATASTFKLDAAQILEPGAPTVDKMLQGKVPGLMIVNNSGSVNAAPTIRLRGTATFMGNASPVWVVDGIIRPDPVQVGSANVNAALSGNYNMLGSAVAGLNPYDIESMTFLRDAAATAIYGVRAANGVIVIQTKRGKEGPLQVGYNTDMSFQGRPSYNQLNLMNSEERMNFSREIVEDGLIRDPMTRNLVPGSSFEGLTQKLYGRELTEEQYKAAVQASMARNTDWFKLLFRNSFSMNHSLNLSSGTEKYNWYASLGYGRNNGAAKLDGNERYTANIKMAAKITNRLRADMHLMSSYSKMTGYFESANPMDYAIQTSRFIDPEERYPISKASNTRDANYILPPHNFNILDEIDRTLSTSSARNTTLGLNLSYDFGGGWRFMHSSSAVSDVNENFNAGFENSYYVSYHRGWDMEVTPRESERAISLLPKGGLARHSNANSLSLSMRNTLDFTKMLFDARDQFNFSIGTEVTSNKLDGQFTMMPGYYHDRGRSFNLDLNLKPDNPYRRHILEDKLDNRLGVYPSLSYNLMGKYVVGLTARYDGSNRFGQYSNQKFLPNYGLSLRWDVHQEKLLQNIKWLDRFTLRTSYGTQGAVITQVGPNLIVTFSPLEASSSLNGRPPVTIKSLPYPDLRWEKTHQLNFAMELGLLQNRVNLQLQHYRKSSVDLVTARDIPLENGVNTMYINSGEMSNQGWELYATIVPLRNKNMELSFTFNNSFNKNTIASQGYRNTVFDYMNGTANTPGFPVGALYSFAFKGLNPANGRPDFYYLDKQDAKSPSDFMVYSGQKDPKFFGSFTPQLRYKNFSMIANLYYSLGSHKRLDPLFKRVMEQSGIPAAGMNINRDLANRWRKPGDERYTNIPVIADASFREQPDIPAYTGTASLRMSMYQLYDASDIRVVDASFLRCKNISLYYSVPQERIKRSGLKGLRMGVSASNPFTIASSKLNGQDPEVDGVGTTRLPITRQYAWTISADF
ncbi:SusC/RagA family TonB-linked outer membrane protein [Chitinophaga lutea]